MVQRNDWHDAGLDQVVHEFDVVIHGLLIHRIVSSTKRDNSWPCNAESVGFCTQGFQQRDVLGCAVVGVAGYAAVGAVTDLARSIGKRVPD